MTNAVTHISPKNAEHADIYDLFVVGGGVNGTGIAADAQGRGLKVMLCEQNDLASATSSASSKLIHGGLRYLEHYEFRLVREALAEREVLLNNAPHLIKPLRFVLPHRPHLRPAWMIRIGLFMYDHLSARNHLPASRGVKLDSADESNPLNDDIHYGFKYSDCRVDDSRLVVTNAVSAEQNGAVILTRTRCQSAFRKNGLWHISVEDLVTGKISYCRAKALINASGPWAQKFIESKVQQKSPRGIRLIKGSHFVVPKMYDGEQAYILQNEDQRIVFVIPYNKDFTLVGTTDKEYTGDPKDVAMDSEEEAYLLDVVNKHFSKQLTSEDVLWSYSGVRPLCDDESDSPSAITRDYTLELEADEDNKAPMLSIFGGKITTYRKLSEAAVATLEPFFPNMAKPWTKDAPLPGAEFGESSFAEWQQAMAEKYDWLDAKQLERMSNAYGSRIVNALGAAESTADLGEHFGSDLYANEVDYLIREEWARSADDVLWRRSKIGLYLNKEQQARLNAYIEERLPTILSLKEVESADLLKVSG